MRENRMSKLRQTELPRSVFVQHLTDHGDHGGWRMVKQVPCIAVWRWQRNAFEISKHGRKLSEVMPQNPKGSKRCTMSLPTHLQRPTVKCVTMEMRGNVTLKAARTLPNLKWIIEANKRGQTKAILTLQERDYLTALPRNWESAHSLKFMSSWLDRLSISLANMGQSWFSTELFKVLTLPLFLLAAWPAFLCSSDFVLAFQSLKSDGMSLVWPVMSGLDTHFLWPGVF